MKFSKSIHHRAVRDTLQETISGPAEVSLGPAEIAVEDAMDAAVLRVLGDASRLRILHLLAGDARPDVAELAAYIGHN